MSALLELHGIDKVFAGRKRWFGPTPAPVRAVSGLSLHVAPGERLGIVGESGSGKTTLARIILGLDRASAGRVVLEGRDVGTLDPAALGLIRRSIQMVFQDPLSSLNPRKTVRQIVRLPLDAQAIGTSAERNARVDALLDAVGLSPRFAKLRPAQLSGGQRQRVGIARALAIDPKLIVLDEPTASLDVSVQARILTLLDRLRDQRQIALILISHNLGVVRHVADRVAVMYLGRIVEIGPAAAIFANAQHPYTQALFAAIPALDDEELVELKRGERAHGEIAGAGRIPPGCAFHPRCPHAMDRCRNEPPALTQVAPGHAASCHLLTRGA